jgi:pimeloyl-ACP methyl ester carboxylesterase
MRTELVEIPAEPSHPPLDGLYYEPEGRPAAAALLMHGNCGNFYVGLMRFLPPILASLGIASLAYNRRGHDILGTYRGRFPVGGALQITEEGVADNRAAAEFLRGKGFPAPIVIGHSNGGMLGVRHVVDHPETPALVLLSAAGGRPGRGPNYFVGDHQDELTERARRLVDEGQPDQLMLLPNWWWTITARSFLDRIERPRTVEMAPDVRCPSIFIKGREESDERYPAEEFREASGGPCEVVQIPDCDHWYNGHDDEVCELIAGWLTRTLPGIVRAAA